MTDALHVTVNLPAPERGPLWLAPYSQLLISVTDQVVSSVWRGVTSISAVAWCHRASAVFV